MTTARQIALFFIAACAISTGANGQSVYKCGKTYSQIPCPGGKTLDTSDSRSKAQKAAADRNAARQMEAAKTMEKQRIKEEQAALKQHEVEMKALNEEAKGPKKDSITAPVKKSKAPEFFTAKPPSPAKP